MNQSQIPVRYARALFLSGKEKKILDKISNDILILDSFFKNNPSINAWLKSPVIKAEDKKNLFRKEFEDRISKITLKFINLVINKKREQYFTDIFRNFLQFHKTDAGIRTLVLTTATGIDQVISQKVSHRFDQRDKTNHELVTRIKPSIIGGFMLQIDDILYDASIATELKRLKKELTGQVKQEVVIKADQK